MTYKTADNQIVPEPISRQIHQYSFYKSSEGRQVTLAVLEIRQPTFTTLTLSEATEGYETFAAEYLTGILALRLAEGATIISASERHFTLSAFPSDDAGPAGLPLCSRCGSSRIVRDACVRWDTITRRWALADVHDCDFCESCNAEGDELARWSSGNEAPPLSPDAGGSS